VSRVKHIEVNLRFYSISKLIIQYLTLLVKKENFAGALFCLVVTIFNDVFVSRVVQMHVPGVLLPPRLLLLGYVVDVAHVIPLIYLSIADL